MGTEDIDKLRETSAAPLQKMEFGADQLQQDESRWTNQIGPVNLGEREPRPSRIERHGSVVSTLVPNENTR
jgi:hypothetical protein